MLSLLCLFFDMVSNAQPEWLYLPTGFLHELCMPFDVPFCKASPVICGRPLGGEIAYRKLHIEASLQHTLHQLKFYTALKRAL